MKAVLLCGYRDNEASDSTEAVMGLERDGDGTTQLDRQILNLRALDFEVICVVAGRSAEAQLRQSSQIEQVELVFDTNVPCTLLSNVRSAAFACANEAALVLPLEIPVPDRDFFSFLRNEHGKVGFATSHTFLQAVSEGAPCHFGFPLLMTREGSNTLRKFTDLVSLVDPRLKTLQLEFLPKPALEPADQPL